ncbi:MAG: AAA family ATPase [Chloroflexi bacterium]|nr:AAA family ATPase [Chloroflexota bacterium]
MPDAGAVDVTDEMRYQLSSRVKPLQVAVVGKGGAGKTTISAALMQSLSRRELRVLAVDADPTALLGTYIGVSLQGTAGQAVEEARRAVRGGMVSRPRDMVEAEIRRSLVHTPFGDLLTMGAVGGRGCYCAPNSVLRAMLKEMVETHASGTGTADSARSASSAGSSGYDVLLVDSEPGLEIFSRGTLDGADELVVVAEPTAAGLLVAAQIWQTAEELGLYGARQRQETRPVLLNKLKVPCSTLYNVHGTLNEAALPSHVLRLLVQHRLKAEWVIPYDNRTAEAVECGQSVVTLATLDGNSGFVRSVDGLAKALLSAAKYSRRVGCTGPDQE